MIFTSAKLIASDDLQISNFFSFLAAMMLAYQPVRSLATLNIAIQQGISGARRVLPVIDDVPEINDKKGVNELIFESLMSIGLALAESLMSFFWSIIGKILDAAERPAFKIILRGDKDLTGW